MQVQVNYVRIILLYFLWPQTVLRSSEKLSFQKYFIQKTQIFFAKPPDQYFPSEFTKNSLISHDFLKNPENFFKKRNKKSEKSI